MSRRTPRQDPYWNHNVRYHRLVLDAVPDGCGRALDIGCGDGLLVRKLAGRAREVTGVDRSVAICRGATRSCGRNRRKAPSTVPPRTASTVAPETASHAGSLGRSSSPSGGCRGRPGWRPATPKLSAVGAGGLSGV
ncbi:class I SAM-dependent methyltransferase [Streptomyces celluloflavus]|uniref:class I SAM-dependent methyltransferase n=1 Tax=Streptomyces celluloflavus TaxID=58344 RepID=UPI0036D7DD1E